MSTTPSSPVPPLHPAHVAQATKPPFRQREVRIYSHSTLFYWWPVWAVGFLMGVLTLTSGHRMAVVPTGTEAEKNRVVQGREELGPRNVLIVPPEKNSEQEFEKPHLHMAPSPRLGVIFATFLLIIIVVTNAPMRGLWSVLLILFILLLSVVFALFGWWDTILENLGRIDIRINAGGYFFISTLLLIIWALAVFVFDRRTYVIISSGQVRVCLAVGAGETAYDTTGMTFQKKQDDLFRHWVVGLGSGDLIIHRTNTNQEIDMPNVLFIGAKIREIEKLLKEREVV